MRLRLIFAISMAVILAGGTVTAVAFSPSHRVRTIETLCLAGLPNLSRPRDVDANDAGCSVFGPKTRVTGFWEYGFEASSLAIGDRYLVADGRYRNEYIWFECRPDVALCVAITRSVEIAPKDDCFIRVAKITAEGRMVESRVGVGHLNLARRKFLADRIVSARPASVEDLAPLTRYSGDHACPAELATTAK